MWATTSRTAATMQLSLTLGRTTLLRVRVPSLLPTSSSSTLTPALALAPSAAPPAPSTSSPWSTLWDGLLRAVPKKKVSHSRKSMRAANKGLKDRTDLVHCSGCGKPKLHHHICAYCYFELNRARKVALKQEGGLAQGSPQQHQQ